MAFTMVTLAKLSVGNHFHNILDLPITVHTHNVSKHYRDHLVPEKHNQYGWYYYVCTYGILLYIPDMKLLYIRIASVTIETVLLYSNFMMYKVLATV